MAQRGSSQTPARRQLLRILAVVGGAIAFLGIATLVNPTSSIARVIRGNSGFALANGKPGTAASADSDTNSHRPSLGTLAGPEFKVSIFAAAGPATYSIYDASGKPIVVDVTGPEVYKSVPDLDVRSMIADVEVDSAY